MRFVIAGYIVILGVLFLYAVQLVWRRRRLAGVVAAVAAGAAVAAVPPEAAAGEPSIGRT